MEPNRLFKMLSDLAKPAQGEEMTPIMRKLMSNTQTSQGVVGLTEENKGGISKTTTYHEYTHEVLRQQIRDKGGDPDDVMKILKNMEED